MKSETKYQAELVDKIEDMFPGCMVMRTNPRDRQGLPDLLILHEHMWAALEVKQHSDAPERPNQAYYVDMMDEMSFAAFIYPENEERVLRELQQAFRS